MMGPTIKDGIQRLIDMQPTFRWATAGRGPVAPDPGSFAGSSNFARGITSRRVLVVDDDVIQGDQLAMFLQSQGVEVDVVRSGGAAIESIERDTPAIVLMDVKMPGMSGIDVARHIVQTRPRPKVILMSGFPEMVFDAHRDGDQIFAVIQKPVPLPQLLQFVRRALN